MALPKLVGQGVSSAAAAIGKSVKTGRKAFTALAASQMEPEVLAGIAGIKTLSKRFKGRGEDSGDLSQLQQSVEEVAPETTGPIVEKLEQIPPQTSEPIVEKIEELKEAKEAEANLEPVIEKLDELTPMVEKIDQLAEQNETDLFNSNFILDNINQGIEKISSLFESMVQRKAKERSDSLEEKREASRSRKTSKSQSRLSLPTRDRTGGGGGFFDTLKGLFSGPLMSLLAGGAGGGIIGIITAALPAIGGILAAVLPIALPLILTAATAAGIYAFLQSEMADDISTWIAGLIYDAGTAMDRLNEKSKNFIEELLRAEKERNDRIAQIPELERPAFDRAQEDMADARANAARGRASGGAAETNAVASSSSTAAIEVEIINKRNEIKRLEQEIVDVNAKEEGFLAWMGRTIKEIPYMIMGAAAGPSAVGSVEAIRALDSVNDAGLRRSMLDNIGVLDGTLTESEANIPVIENLIETTKRDIRILEGELEQRTSSSSTDSGTTIGNVDNSNNTTNVSITNDRRPEFGGNLVGSPGI